MLGSDLRGAARKACLLAFLAAAGCTTTSEQRFTLDYLTGIEAAHRLDTAQEAFPVYQRMATDLERQGNFADAAIAYSNASITARTLGRLQEALNASLKAVEMGERAGGSRNIAVPLDRLGWTYLWLNAPDKAIPVFERELPHAKALRWESVEASCYYGLSWAYRLLGRPELALENANKGVEFLEAVLRGRTIELSRSGLQGQRSLANLERNYADMLEHLGWSHLALGNLELAESAFKRSLKVGSSLRLAQRQAFAYAGLGFTAQRKGNHQAAVSHLSEALRLSTRPQFSASVQGTLGQVYRSMERLPEAEDALQKAVEGIEDLRSQLGSEGLRESFFEDKAATYEALVLTLVDREKVSEAFDLSERARARAFLDLLGNRVKLGRRLSETLKAEERVLREGISALKAQPEDFPVLRRELELAREAYQAFLQRVRQMDREQASLMTVEPLTLKEVQELLPEDSILLEYFVTDEKMLLWTVGRGTFSVAILPLQRAEVARRIQAFRGLIASRGREIEMRYMAQTLFDQLVRPGLRQRAPKELLIVPHDSLHYLPFQALMPAPDRYLIQEAPLYYYSSASLMQFTREKAQGGAPNTLAVGNPDLRDPTLNLRYAEREARQMADLFPGAVVLTRQEATKAKVRENSIRHNLLHFATHAELDEMDPLGSGLLFTPDRGDDGRLEVQEIFGWDLQASLVVLSACETALGRLTRGDELVGLTRAFIYAGTPSIITTLWKVNDRASYEVMREFYLNLKAGQNKAEALRHAQIAILAKYPHPYYWAAYQLTGEAR